MSEKTINVIREGFAAAYNNKDGTLGYLTSDATDSLSFSVKPDFQHLHKDADKAARDVASIVNSMEHYYGHEKVDFDTVRVVRYSEQAVIEDVTKEIIQQSLLDSAIAKLTPLEFEAVARHSQPRA